MVSQSLYSSLKTNDLKIIYDDLEIDLKIVGVLYPSLFEEKNIYCSSLLQEKIPFLKDDYSLVLESQDIKNLPIFHYLEKEICLFVIVYVLFLEVKKITKH